MRKIRLILVVFSFLFFLTVSMAFAGSFIPPDSAAEKGKVSLEAGYFYYSGKWASDNSGWGEVRFISNQPYVQASYGFLKNAEMYLRLGAADLKISNAFASGSGLSGFKNDFSDQMKPFVSAGVMGDFNFTPSLGVSPFLQVNLYSSYKDSTSGTIVGYPVTQEIEIKNPREASIGVALKNKVRGVVLYAGPVVGWSETNVATKLIIPGFGEATNSATYREKNNYGAFAGLQAPLGKKFTLEIKGQMKSEFSGGLALIHRF